MYLLHIFNEFFDYWKFFKHYDDMRSVRDIYAYDENNNIKTYVCIDYDDFDIDS